MLLGDIEAFTYNIGVGIVNIVWAIMDLEYFIAVIRDQTPFNIWQALIAFIALSSGHWMLNTLLGLPTLDATIVLSLHKEDK